MSGNVWEWTRSLWGKYPYPVDGRARAEREDLRASRGDARVLRGGAFNNYRRNARCAYRYGGVPDLRYDRFGFRVVVSPIRP